jgi:hypothetical protein
VKPPGEPERREEKRREEKRREEKKKACPHGLPRRAGKREKNLNDDR